MKKVILASLSIAFLSIFLIQEQAAAQVIVGHPCRLRPGANRLNTDIGHHRLAPGFCGLNQGDYAVDLNDECADNNMIAPIDGIVTNTTLGGNCPVTGRAEINPVIEIVGDDGTKVKLIHGISAVQNGQRVRRGEVVGTIASIGCSTGNHIHFEVWRNGNGCPLIHNQWQFGNPEPPGPAGPPADYLQLTSFLRRADGHEMCIDIVNNDRFDRNDIQLFECNNGTAQKFFFETHTGFIRLFDDTSWCLDIEDGRLQNNTEIKLHSCNNTDAQRFYYDRSMKQIIVAAEPSLCIDVDGANANNGTNIKISDCRPHNPAQQFHLPQRVRIRAIDIQDRNRREMCIDIPGARFESENNIQAVACNGGGAQSFYYDNRTGNILSTERPNLCIDVSGGNLVERSDIQLYECNRSPAQNFRHDPERHMIRLGEQPAVCMDMADAGQQNASNIQAWNCNYTDPQRFILE